MVPAKRGLQMRKIRPKQIIIWFSISLFIIQLGCAHAPPRPPAKTERAQFGTIGIVSSRFIPEAKSRGTFAKEWLSGAGKGAASGAEIGIKGCGMFALEMLAEIGHPLVILLAPCLVLAGAVGGAVVGGVWGAVEGAGKRAGKVQQIEAVVNNALSELKIQETMAEHLLKTCRGLENYRFDLLKEEGPTSPEEKLTYGFLNEKGIDTALELSVMSLGCEVGKDWSIGFFMTVRTRLIRTIDGTEVYCRKFEYKSGNQNFVSWAEFDAQKSREEFACCYKSLAERIVEEVFLLTDLPLGPRREGTHGLQPKYPELRYNFWSTSLEFVEVDSVQPELQWEAFPRAENREADDTGVLSRISDVSYDLKIWKADENDLPGELVYTRRGLPGPSHRIETSLPPSTKYFWSIRLRSKMDSHFRVSHWALSRKGGYFRFVTPDQ